MFSSDNYIYMAHSWPPKMNISSNVKTLSENFDKRSRISTKISKFIKLQTKNYLDFLIVHRMTFKTRSAITCAFNGKLSTSKNVCKMLSATLTQSRQRSSQKKPFENWLRLNRKHTLTTSNICFKRRQMRKKTDNQAFRISFRI